MSNTIQLQQSVLQDVASLLDDNEAMKKLQKYLRRLKNERMAKEEMSAKEKEEILSDIRDGLREVKAARKSGVRLQSVEDFLYEIRD